VKGSPSNGYAPLTKKILQYGGGVINAESPYAWLFKVPPTVKSYTECFEQMVEN
jgi:hypothetical protein